MKYLNKLAISFCAAVLGLVALASCEGADQYDVNAPDWLSSKIDSISKAKQNSGGEFVIPDVHEDVYTIGATDFSTGWWASFSKYYVIPEDTTWRAVFNLNINPSATNTYKNFALIICNDKGRSDTGYTEYGAIRYDYQPSGNSEWGDYIDRDCASSNLEFSTDTDEGIDKLGGKVVLTVDRSDPNAFTVTMSNGTITKTYKQKTPLVNLNDDASDTNIRCFIVPEGSYVNFIGSNIEPIGGYTSAEDKEPSAMSVSGIPDEVLVGSSIEDIMSTVSASISFDGLPDPVSVSNAELLAYVEGSLDQPGEVELYVMYNKTFKGVNCSAPIFMHTKIKVVTELSAYTEKYVCPDPVILGAEDNSTAFWGAHTNNIKVEPKQTVVTSFTNYTSGAANWDNYITVLCSADGSTEYGVMRADNYGWGSGYAGIATATTTVGDWATWLAGMNGAHVVEYITNNGDGTAEVDAVVTATDGTVYYQVYSGIKVDMDNLYFNYTVEAAHLVFDTMVGAEDNSTAFWGAHSTAVKIPAHTIYTTSFTNYTCGASNWNNFVVCLTSNENNYQPEYGIVRADNYGWGNGYGSCIATTTVPDWDTWLAAMNGAKVDLTVSNNGDGTADVKAIMHGTDGVDYTQTYTGIAVTADDLCCRLTVDNSHIEFSPAVSQAKRNAIQIAPGAANSIRRASTNSLYRHRW